MSVKAKKIIDQIRKIIKPEKIILFGSYADGKPSVNSDIDLAVIIKKSDKKYHDRLVEIRQKIRTTIPLDLFIFTRAETEELGMVNPFISDIFTRGKVVYG